MNNLLPWRQSLDCETEVSRFCQEGGYSPSHLYPIIFSQRRLEKWIPQTRVFRSTPAFSIGALIPRLELFGKVIVDHDVPVGIICLEENFEHGLAGQERRFLLAHEYSHIVKNHTPFELLGHVASSIISNYISEVEDTKTKLLLGGAWLLIQTKISHAFTRQCELDADAHAVVLTGDRAGAIATIRMLGDQFAGSLNAPSHWISRGRLKIPVVTYQERIDAL